MQQPSLRQAWQETSSLVIALWWLANHTALMGG